MRSEISPIVAVEKVSTQRAEQLENQIEQMLSHLGGIKAFVRPGMKVLLKPDLSDSSHCGKLNRTYLNLIIAAGRLVRKAGGRVQIGDSPCLLPGLVEHVWRSSGLWQVARRESFQLLNFEKTGTLPVAIETRVYFLSCAALQADLVINLPKLYSVDRLSFSGAMANLLGLVPGFQKGRYRTTAPNSNQLAGILVDITSAVQTGLNVMYANGHVAGKGLRGNEISHSGLLLVSTDSVALDTVGAHLLGIPSDHIESIRHAAESGLGIGKLEAIKLVGEPLGGAVEIDHSLTARRKWRILSDLTAQIAGHFLWMRPSINMSTCTKCGICLQSCPTGAMRLGKADLLPIVHHRVCVSCWRCHEVCPIDAVAVEKSWLAKQVYG